MCNTMYNHEAFESAKRLCAAGNKSMLDMIELFSCGPFTPVEFFYQRGHIVLRAHNPDTAGVLVATLTGVV